MSSTNIFAALQKKKKSSGKSKDSAAAKEETVNKQAELEKAIFASVPAAAASNWADDDSDDEWDGQAPEARAEEPGWNQVRGIMRHCFL
jgi:hypothetical protein